MNTIKFLAATLLLVAAQFNSFSQDKSGTKEVYCQIVGTQKLLNPNKVTIQVDYGEERSMWKDNRVREEESGKVKVFNSMIDALNYMGQEGWEFVQAYVISVGSQNVYHYLLKRPVEK